MIKVSHGTGLLPWRGERLGPCAGSLESKIDRTLAYWSCTMADALLNSDQMSRQELNSLVIEINEEAAF